MTQTEKKSTEYVANYFIAEGETLEAIQRFLADDKAWQEKFIADSKEMMLKYGATRFYLGGRLSFASSKRYDDQLWIEHPRLDGYRARLRYNGQTVPGGAERRKELEAVGKNRPQWSGVWGGSKPYNRGLIVAAPEYITPNPHGVGGILHDTSVFFEEVAGVMLATFKAPRGDYSQVPKGCTKRLLPWEVEKMRWEHEEAQWKQEQEVPCTTP